MLTEKHIRGCWRWEEGGGFKEEQRNIPKLTKLYTLSSSSLLHVNYASVKLLF